MPTPTTTTAIAPPRTHFFVRDIDNWLPDQLCQRAVDVGGRGKRRSVSHSLDRSGCALVENYVRKKPTVHSHTSVTAENRLAPPPKGTDSRSSRLTCPPHRHALEGSDDEDRPWPSVSAIVTPAARWAQHRASNLGLRLSFEAAW